jgi:hypothetical protein
MFDTIFSLPIHPLVVHATVVILPTAALSVALAAGWSRFRRWAGFLPLLLSVVAIILVPVSTSSGEALEGHVGHSALIEEHAHLAGELWIPVAVLVVAAACLYWLHIREASSRGADPGTGRLAVIMVIAAVGVAGTLVQVARVGHSGAKSAWGDVATSTVPPDQGNN